MSSSYRSSRPTAFGNKRRYSYPQGGASKRGGQYIDPARFVRKATLTATEEYTPQNQFSDFEIHDLLKANVAAKGYTTPSPIQDQTIIPALAGKDIIGVAGTGTGKTAAFALPILNRLMNDRDAKALVIAPTRELAQQIEAEFRSIAKGSGLSGTLLIGGTNISPQLRDLRNNPRVVMGTPGRIKDHLERNSLRLDAFNIVVLDEVDRMLDMGFVQDVRTILSNLNQTRQSFFFSATLDNRVQTLIQTFANDPVTFQLKTNDTSELVNQDVVRYSGNTEKMEKLHDILNSAEAKKVIVFDSTQRSVERLSVELTQRGFSADAIHGGKSQGQRQRALDKFKNSHINILVATDVAARGIDVKDITHVINYSQPQTYDDYIHRIGRAGRAGQVGHALTFVIGS